MISAGNDIVALSDIDRRRTVEPRFYSRIISHSEQELYPRLASPAMSFENFVWLLWSVKESAYKYWQRLKPELIFSPARITVSELNDPSGGNSGALVYQGIVHSVAGRLYSRSTMTADHISTVVSADQRFENVWSGIAATGRTDRAGQSASVRALLLEKLGSLLSCDGEELRVEKSPQGCPLLYKREKEMGIPVSLAHHGRFIAYSFVLNRPDPASGCADPISGRADLPGILPDKVLPTA